MTNSKSHTRFRILDDLERLLRTLFQSTCVFAVFPGDGRQTTLGLLKTATIFSNFARYFLRIFRGKANIII